MKDKQLLALLRKDPQKGLAETVDRYSAYVLKIAYTKLNGVCSREDIEEAVSDIFMAFYTGGMKCGFEIRSVTAFISVIAERHCLDLFRQKRRQPESVPIEEYEDVLADGGADPSGSGIADALYSLGEPDTSIFIRKYFFGQSSENIAKELGMKTNTVNQRISRGLKKLKKILEEGA